MKVVVGLVLLSLLVSIGYVHCLDAASLEGHILAVFSHTTSPVALISTLGLINTTTGTLTDQWTLNPPMYNPRYWNSFVFTTYDSTTTSYCYGFNNQTQFHCLNVLSSQTVTVSVPADSTYTTIYALTSSGGVLYGIRGSGISNLQYFAVNIATGVSRIYGEYKYPRGEGYLLSSTALYVNIDQANYLFYTYRSTTGEMRWVEVNLDTGVTNIRDGNGTCYSRYYSVLQYSGGQIYGGSYYEIGLITRTSNCTDWNTLWYLGKDAPANTIVTTPVLNPQKNELYTYVFASSQNNLTGFYTFNWNTRTAANIQGNSVINATQWRIVL